MYIKGAFSVYKKYSTIVHNCPNDIKIKYKFTGNRAYRSEYSFRLNNNKIINELFKNGYRIGLNS